MRWFYKSVVALALLLVPLAQAQAGDMDYSNINLYPPVDYTGGMMVAQNDSDEPVLVGEPTDTPFEEPMMTADKLHGYLGAASFLMAMAAAATAPDNDNPALAGQPAKKGFHHYAGISAAALGGAAVLSGFILHTDDLEPDLLDPDTMHMLLGVLSTAAYAYAVSKGPKQLGMGSNRHAAAGMAGAGMMAVALYLEF